MTAAAKQDPNRLITVAQAQRCVEDAHHQFMRPDPERVFDEATRRIHELRSLATMLAALGVVFKAAGDEAHLHSTELMGGLGVIAAHLGQDLFGLEQDVKSLYRRIPNSDTAALAERTRRVPKKRGTR